VQTAAGPGDRVALPDLTRGASRPEAIAQAYTSAGAREARRPRRRPPARLPRPGEPGYEPWPSLPPKWRPVADLTAMVLAAAFVLSMILIGVLS
jgi:hypothetical protein